MNLNNVLAKAQRMMLDEDWNRQVEMGAAAQRAGSINGNRGGVTPDIAAMERMAFGSSSSEPMVSGYERNPIPQNARIAPQQYRNDGSIQMLQEQRQSRTNSRLPKAVLESYEEMPSPLETYEEPAFTIGNGGGGIDYNYIKHLIDESIEQHLRGNLNEGLKLNEIKGMRIAQGSVIQFIDTKGNLYEGQLKLKKRAK